MRNSMTSLSSLFNNAIFRIPDYQRGYAWDNNQLNDFWDDLYNLTEDRYHYTGMLSLKELSIKDCYRWEEDKWILENGYRAYTVVVKWVSVTYETPQGTKTNKLIGVLPPRLEEGREIEVRFNKENPDVVTAEMIDWFPAVFLLALGVLYAVGGILVVIFRKKAGYYAIVEQTDEPTPIEDDDFSIIETISQEEP